MEYENYPQTLETLKYSILRSHIRRRDILGVHISWLKDTKAMALVTAAAERTWQIDHQQQQQDPPNLPAHVWKNEIESWERKGLDTMWEHLTTGDSLNTTNLDPDVFSENQWMSQSTLTLTLAETFNFAMRRRSTERAINISLGHLFGYWPRSFHRYRADWYRDTFPSQSYLTLENDEQNIVSLSYPLRLVPYSWVERDIAILNEADDGDTFEGLRELATLDAQVGLELQKKLYEVVMPATGPITAEVWPADMCRMVETAIAETLQQTLSTRNS